MITGWKVRKSAIRARAVQASGNGDRLRAAMSPSGSDRSTPDYRRDDGDLQALGHAMIEQLELVMGEIGRKHPG